MKILNVEVSDETAIKFAGQNIVKIEDLLDCEDELKYTFSNEKVSLLELSNFLGKTIATKKGSIC